MLGGVAEWLGGIFAGSMVGGLNTPNAIVEAWNQFFNRMLQMSLMPLDVLAYLRSRGMITEEQYKDLMKNWGYPEVYAEGIYEALRNRPTISELIRGIFYRHATPNNIDDIWNAIRDYIKDYGISENYANVIVDSYRFLPSLSDVLQWMAKEAFEDDIARELGLDEEFPPLFAEYAAKLGVPPEDAKRYWRAHWSTIGFSQMAEAFHRYRADAYVEGRHDAEVRRWDDYWDIFFRQVEVPRFYREMLKKITYNVITRVDARRMYEMGFLTKEELTAIYIALGYTKEDAERMADWVAWEVQRYEEEDLRGLSKSSVESLYKYGLINDHEYLDLMKKIGYGEEAAEYSLELLKSRIFMENFEKRVDTIKKRYLKGLITKDEARQELARLGVEASWAGEIIETWEADKIESFKQLSKEDIRNAIRYKILSLEEGYNKLLEIGYTKDDAKILLRIWGASKEDVNKLN